MKSPKISVITVCYNCATILKETAMSVLSQTHNNFEYIIIDGGSKDNTNDVIDDIKAIAATKKIPVTAVSEKDKGVYDAMNKGAKLATGDYILYMNAGDYFFAEDSLDKLCTPLDITIDVLYGDTLMVFNWGEIINSPSTPTIENPMPFIHQSCLTKRDELLKHPFDLSYKIIADHNLYYALKKEGCKFIYNPVTVSRYDARNGISADNPYKQYVEHAQIHGYTKQWWYPFRKFYYMCRFGLQMRIKSILPKKYKDNIERKRREKLFNTKAQKHHANTSSN